MPPKYHSNFLKNIEIIVCYEPDECSAECSRIAPIYPILIQRSGAQAELQRSRGEVQALNRRLVGMEAEKASISAGRREAGPDPFFSFSPPTFAPAQRFFAEPETLSATPGEPGDGGATQQNREPIHRASQGH